MLTCFKWWCIGCLLAVVGFMLLIIVWYLLLEFGLFALLGGLILLSAVLGLFFLVERLD